MKPARVPCGYCPSSVAPGEPCSACGKVTTKPDGSPLFFTGGEVPRDLVIVLPDRCAGRLVNDGFERVAEGPVRELLGSGLYFAPFDKLSAIDAARLTSALLGS